MSHSNASFEMTGDTTGQWDLRSIEEAYGKHMAQEFKLLLQLFRVPLRPILRHRHRHLPLLLLVEKQLNCLERL